MIRSRLSFALALLLAGCVAAPPPPPLPPPPFTYLVGEIPPPPEEDLARVRAYEAERGFKYSDEQVRLSLLSMLARRAEVSGLPGYSKVWSEAGNYYVNMKPPFDRGAVLALAAPELRPLLQIRAVRFAAGEIQPIASRLGESVAPLKADFSITYNQRTDRFEIGVEKAMMAQVRAKIPLDLAPFTDVIEGGVVLVRAARSDSERT